MSEERKDHADNNNISTTDPDFSWLSEPLVHGAVDIMYQIMKGPFMDENLNMTDFAEWMENESNLPELWDIGNRPLPTYNADLIDMSTKEHAQQYLNQLGKPLCARIQEDIKEMKEAIQKMNEALQRQDKLRAKISFFCER